MPLQINSEIIVTIEKPVAGGRMLARHEGQIVFVAGAIPGERVRVRVNRVSKQLAFADTIGVLDASSDRRAVDADWACGGSHYAHVVYERQLRLKSEVIEDGFARIAKTTLAAPVPVMPSQEQGYRMRGRLHAKGGAFGFFREGTHDICDAGPTRQLLPATIDALQKLQSALGRTRAASCELSENAEATDGRCCSNWSPPNHPAHVDPIEGISGLLFGDHQWGIQRFAYGSPTSPAHRRFQGFGCLTHQFIVLSRQSYLLPDSSAACLRTCRRHVMDLYAGVGLFAASLAAHGQRQIVAVEGDRSSARDLESNAEAYGSAIHVQHLSVENYLQRRSLQRPDTIVLDPPRTGVSREAMSGMLGLKVPRVVYVSCDPATLARDVKRFSEVGYRLDHIEAFDLFPNTAHVETLAVLTR